MDEAWIPQVDLSKPVIVVRMRLEFFKLIDSNHQLAKVRRMGVRKIPAYYFTEHQRWNFFTREQTNTMYVVKYWNEKWEQVERGWGQWAVVGRKEV